MRQRLRAFLAWLHSALQPKPDQTLTIKALAEELAESHRIQAREDRGRIEWLSELIEARQMAGAGPWRIGPDTAAYADRIIAQAESGPRRLRESDAIGAMGEIDLMLDTLEWRRETNYSLLQFSRWGIQILILICRLQYLKHPWIRRGVDIAAAYVFGRGFEVSSSDETATKVLDDFFARNRETLGQIALADTHRRKFYDGNVFWVLFPDQVNTGETNIRTIDATEIMEIVSDPNDSDKPRYYKRCWAQQTFDEKTGAFSAQTMTAWYPALGYSPDSKPRMIGSIPCMWGVDPQYPYAPVHHRKCGAVSKWKFGCPLIFPALDYARAGKDFLGHSMTVRQSLAQFAWSLTTKGGAQAIAGAKQGIGTNVGPPNNLRDTNPPAGAGSLFASGPGTTLSAMNTKGAGGDMADIKYILNMVACCLGLPPTFLAEVETANLATATTLDRPTELNFLGQQEEWREDFIIISEFVLMVSKGAPSGRLKESLKSRTVTIREAKRIRSADGKRMIYEAAKPDPDEIDVRVSFPAIREGDLVQTVAALVEGLTLGNKGGQIVGIDEKRGIHKLAEAVGIEDPDEMVEEMFPEGEYDPNRANQLLTAPIGKAVPDAGGVPQLPGGKDPAAVDKTVSTSKESVMQRAAKLLERALVRLES